MIRKAFLIDNDPKAPRPGEPVLIVGVKFLKRFGVDTPCYELHYSDDDTGFIPVNKKTCKLVPQYGLLGL